MRGLRARAPELLVWIAVALVTATFLFSMTGVFGTFMSRTLDGVEGDVLFEAKRIRDGLPLWVPPEIGAGEYGPPPSRYYVLYPPLWSAVVSLVPEHAAAAFARGVNAFAWLAVLAFLVWRMPPARRRPGLVLAAYVGSSFLLASYAMCGRPDGVAVVLSGLALARTASRRRLDVVSGALFALAAWTKPNVVGALPGAALALVLLGSGSFRARILRVLPGITAGVTVTAVVVAVLTRASHGAWLSHLLASTVQPPDLELLVTHLVSRVPMFGLPLGGALWLAVRAERRAAPESRPTSAGVAGGALATSLAWCIVSYAKIGSAANYLLEPCLCALVVMAHVDLPLQRLGFAARTALAGLLVGQMAWTCIASIEGASSVLRVMGTRTAFLAHAREACGARPDELVLADEPGLEMTLNGRLAQTPFQSTQLARRGRFPLEAWLADLDDPRVRCFVMQDDLLERDLSVVEPPHDLLPVEVRAKLRASMVLVREEEELYLYRRR